MKKIILGLALSIGLITPALADPTPPSDITLMSVRLGHLVGNTVDMYDTESNKSVTVQIYGCEESWQDGERFILIKTRAGDFVALRAARFFSYYNGPANHDWDMAVKMVDNDHAICNVTSK